MQGPTGKILCPLRSGAERAPDSIAVVGAHQALSYAELDRRVSETSTRLLAAGCEPGTRVALYLPRDERYVVLLLALLRTGCVSCPVSTRLPREGAARLLDKAACQVLISEDEGLLERVPPGVRGLRSEELSGVAGKGPEEPIYLSLGQPATIIFTSGSTGGPKAALHTLGNHYYSALGSNVNIGLSKGDRWLLSLPLYHVGGLSILFRCLLAGATIALPESGAALSRSIKELGVTHVSLVATQLRRLLQEKEETGDLKAVLLGGGPTTESLLREVIVRGIPVYTSYGLTEMSSQVTTTRPGATPAELSTSGRVLEHREVSVSREGEILVRGETLFAGYVGREGTDLPLDKEDWFHTGDLGQIDGRGNLRVTGRLDNLFISGGENVQPEGIEAALERIEGVERAVVVPAPDSEFGERPVAFVQMSGKRTPQSLAEKLEETLPRFEVPVAVYEWPEDADAGRMKPDRRFFQERALLLRRKS